MNDRPCHKFVPQYGGHFYRWSAIVALATFAIAVFPAGALARGEPSLRLPETRGIAATAPATVRTPLWSRAIDAPTADADTLGYGNGLIAFRIGGRICAYTEEQGLLRWCAGQGSSPAYASGVFAFIGSDGSMRAVAEKTGKRLWSVTRPVSLIGIWSTASDFLIAWAEDPSESNAPNYAEVSSAGRVVWKMQLRGISGAPFISGDRALQKFVSGGATITSLLEVLRIGAGGGSIGTIDDGSMVLSVRGSDAVVVEDVRGHVEDSALTFNVQLVNLRDASTLQTFSFEPDYDANHKLWESGTAFDRVRVKVEDGDVYGVIGSKIYRYRLGSALKQRPLLISSDGMYLGGPFKGMSYVRRSDGIWALRARAHDILSQMVVQSKAAVTAITDFGRITYIGLDSGRLLGVDNDTGMIVLDSTPGKVVRIEGDSRHVYVLCSGDDRSRIVVYTRPDVK